jgi:GGDEF domain-containing protein
VHSSIRKIFLNFKIYLVILGLGTIFLTLQLINISQYSDHLAALKNQHILIKQIITTDLSDTNMSSITINGALAELALSVKNSNKPAILDTFLPSTKEQDSLNETLLSTATAFQESTLFWSESMEKSRSAMFERMISAHNLYLIEIDAMVDYQIHHINESITMATITTVTIFILGIFIFFFYQWRLNQIYRDIKNACCIGADGVPPNIVMEEINFLARRLARKTSNATNNPALLNPISGINNEKGMVTSYNLKRNSKNMGSLFLSHFMIDHHDKLISALSKDDLNSVYKKITDILSMYEQPLDVIAHLEDNSFAYLMARNSKDLALTEAEKIIASVQDSLFLSEQGNFKITLSGGLMLKAPSKTLEESLTAVAQITEKAKESGGNRVAQLRDSFDSFR